MARVGHPLPVLVPAFAGSNALASPSSVCDAVGSNLVQNCGFEEGSEGSSAPDWSASDAYFASYFLYSGAMGATPGYSGSISQTLYGLTAGASYTLDFWFAALYGNVTATFDGVGFTPSNQSSDYAEYTETVIPTSTSVILTFSGYGNLDDVSLVAATVAAPEPASIPVLGAGLAGLTGLRRRRASSVR